MRIEGDFVLEKCSLNTVKCPKSGLAGLNGYMFAQSDWLRTATFFLEVHLALLSSPFTDSDKHSKYVVALLATLGGNG